MPLDTGKLANGDLMGTTPEQQSNWLQKCFEIQRKVNAFNRPSAERVAARLEGRGKSEEFVEQPRFIVDQSKRDLPRE